ncbi:hypothetical protein [Streptomyces sp. NPDC101249]|uniref:hypothetical protein n=1 Tax=Streptomyces sp. NPDC101249 TaxID=3366140 RepID=UPI00380E0358
MPASAPTHTHTHPVVLLARTIAAILGILAAVSHIPVTGIVLAALAGYGAVLVLFRRSWNDTTSRAPKTG